MDKTAQFYSRPSYSGGGFPVFSGSRRQRGRGVFGSIKRFLQPVGSSLLKEGLGFVKDMIGSIGKGRSLAQAAKEHGKRRALNAAHAGLNAIDRTMTGKAPPKKRPVRPQRGVKRPTAPMQKCKPIKQRRLF